MHHLVKLTDAIWLLQLVISSLPIHALGDLSQASTGIRTRDPDWEADDLPTELSLPLTTTLVNINDWLTANKLLLNMPKTCYSIFTSPNKNIPNYLNSIKLVNNYIVRSYRDVIVVQQTTGEWDSQLTWDNPNNFWYAGYICHIWS